MSLEHSGHDEHHKAPDASDGMYPMLGRDPVALLNVLFVLLTVGQALLTALLGIICISKQVRKRNAAMRNLLLVSILSTVPQPLLYYGEEILNPNPPFGLCLAQAILKHGSDPMYSVASLALLLEVLCETEFLACCLRRKIRVRLLVALPYAIFVIFALTTASLGAAYPEAVKHLPDDYYCTLLHKSYGRGLEIFSCCIVFFTVSLQIYTIVQCRRIWRNVPHLKPCRVFGKGLCLRVLAFTVCQLFLFVLFALGFYLTSSATHVIPIVYEAAMPLTTFLIFASSSDVLAACRFWTGDRQPLLQTPGSDAVPNDSEAHVSSSLTQPRADGSRSDEAVLEQA